MSWINVAIKAGLITVIAMLAIVAFFSVGPVARAYFCDPPGPATQQNCWKDDRPDPTGSYTCDQLGGFCKNRVCQCGVADPGLCADRPNCPLPNCPIGSPTCAGHTLSWGGTTAHVTDCRCIAGYPGGCISYCSQPVPPPPPPPPPPSAPVLTVTCTGGFTPRANLIWNLVPGRNSNTIEKGDAYPGNPNAFWNFIDRFPWFQPAPGYNQTTYTDTNVVSYGTYSWRIKARPDLPSNTVILTLTPVLCGAPIVDRAAFVSQAVPSTVAAGSTFPITVTFQNNGTTTWTIPTNYKLGSENPQNNLQWGVGRATWSRVDGAPSTGAVSPNSVATFTFNVTAPSTPGVYPMQWAMLRESVAWFTATSPKTPIVNITVTNASPAGSLDAVNCNAESSWGWARDPDNAPGPINVEIWRDGTPPPGSGVLAATVTANQPRPDIPFGDKNHGFSYALPAASPLRDGNPHVYRAYAVNTPSGANPMLIGSPRTMTCKPVPEVVSVTHTDANYCTAPLQDTIAWSSTAFPQTAYQVQIATNPSFGAGTIIYDTGKASQIAMKPFKGGDEPELSAEPLYKRFMRGVRELLSFGSQARAQSYCGQTSGTNQGGIDGNQASIVITSPANGQVFTNPNIAITGNLTSNPLGTSLWGGDAPGCPGGPPWEQGWISNIRVSLNGDFTNCSTGVTCNINGPGTFATYSRAVTLVPGVNTIQTEGIHRYEPYYMPRCHTGQVCTLGTKASPAIQDITVTYNPGPPLPSPPPTGGFSTWSITVPQGVLNFNTTYYARVKVWDASTPVDQTSNWSSPVSWTTAKHAYPDPDFTYDPATPSVGDPVQFTDQTAFSAQGLSWLWDFGDGQSSVDQNPSHTYGAVGSKTVQLQSTDIDGYSCSVSKNLDAKQTLPEFKEVLPR